MNETTDPKLLREFIEVQSEEAFAELVRRHVDLVHSAALRMVRDPSLAEDVTQATFVSLAKSAPRLTGRPTLAGWLHRTARNLAANAVRSEVRRKRREQEAATMSEGEEPEVEWRQLAPLLDDALSDLRDADREAILLRYFNNNSARDMAETLGISEGSAQKRLNRAVGRLRHALAKRGLPLGGGMLAALAANAVQPAPPALVSIIGFTSLSTPAATLAVATTLAMTTLQKSLVGGALLLSLGAGLYVAARPKAPAPPAPSPIVASPPAPADNPIHQAEEQPEPLPPSPPPPPPATMPPPVVADAQPGPQPPATPEPLRLPADAWNNVGFATPEDTLRTRGWAILNGDRDRFKETTHITDAARKILEDMFVRMAEASNDPNKGQILQMILDEGFGVEEGILMPMMAEHRDKTYAGYTLLSTEDLSPDQRRLEIEVHTHSAAPRTETITFQRFDDAWKVLIDEAFLARMMPGQAPTTPPR